MLYFSTLLIPLLMYCSDLYTYSQNHPQAPNATPEPSGSVPSQLASQQRTPEHSDSLASSRCTPDPMLFQPFLFPVSSRFPTSGTLIPDLMLIQPFLFLTSS